MIIVRWDGVGGGVRGIMMVVTIMAVVVGEEEEERVEVVEEIIEIAGINNNIDVRKKTEHPVEERLPCRTFTCIPLLIMPLSCQDSLHESRISTPSMAQTLLYRGSLSY